MSKIVFVTGGMISGKARFAITAFECCDEVRYLCTHPNLNEQIKQRICFTESNNNLSWNVELNFRPAGFECENGTNAIFDNLADLVMASIYEVPYVLENEDEVENKIINDIILSMNGMIEKVKKCGGNLIIISHEAGCCPEPEDETTAKFVRILCAVNQRIANNCTDVYAMISGIPMKIK